MGIPTEKLKMTNNQSDCQHTNIEDVDLHRYKCIECGVIMYYSESARRYFEEGELFEGIKGLGFSA